MKTMAFSAVMLLMATRAFAALPKEEVKRLNESATIVNELRSSPDRGIPQDIWDRAQCVVVIPSLKKAAFLVGGEYGSGVMSCRRGKTWSAPVFMKLAKGSVGFQIGAESIDLVLVVLNQSGAEKLLQDKTSLGADMSVAAGPVGRSADASTDARMSAEMLAYSRTHGLFAGIDVSGGVLRPDVDADQRAYGPGVSARDVVFGPQKVKPLAEARTFTNALQRNARATTGVK